MEAAEAPIRGAPASLAVGTKRSSPTSAGALTEDEALVLARRLQVFSSANRLRLLWELLDGEKRVGELARSVSMSPSLTSFQLRVMREAGLTVTRKQGTRVYYRLHDTNLRDLLVAIRSHHATSKVSALTNTAVSGDEVPVIRVADHRPQGDL